MSPRFKSELFIPGFATRDKLLLRLGGSGINLSSIRFYVKELINPFYD